MTEDKDLYARICDVAEQFPSENQKNFFARVWSRGINDYRCRVKALGFSGLSHILDAGSGFGQWTFALARENEEAQIVGLDVDHDRVNAGNIIADRLGLENVTFHDGSVSETKFRDDTFDGIFSYSVIYLTDYRKTLREFFRIMKPGGLLYFSTNGVGWYLYNLIDTHNGASDFSPRDMAADAIENSLRYFSTGEYRPGKSIIMQSDMVRKELEIAGFDVLSLGAEGTIGADVHKVEPFYSAEKYNHESVWEVLCRKRA